MNVRRLAITLTILWTGYFGGAQRSKADEPLNVFLMAGQSNMAGADSLIDETRGFQQTDADRATKFTGAPVMDGQLSNLYVPWGEIRGHRGSPEGKMVHGPEVGFARTLYARGWRNIAIIKVYGNFPRDVEKWPWGPDQPMYNAWTKFIDARLAELTSQGRSFRVRGFVWHQGIDDAIHGKLADEYERNLSDLIVALRKRYNCDTAPFVLARSCNSSIARAISGSGDDSPMARVRRAQVRVAEKVPQCGWIDVDDLPNVNRHHFTAEGQLTMGQRFAETFLKIEGGK